MVVRKVRQQSHIFFPWILEKYTIDSYTYAVQKVVSELRSARQIMNPSIMSCNSNSWFIPWLSVSMLLSTMTRASTCNFSSPNVPLSTKFIWCREWIWPVYLYWLSVFSGRFPSLQAHWAPSSAGVVTLDLQLELFPPRTRAGIFFSPSDLRTDVHPFI